MAFGEVTCSEKDTQLCHFAQENPNPVTSLVLFSCPLKVGNRKRAGTRDPPLVSCTLKLSGSWRLLLPPCNLRQAEISRVTRL